MRHVAFLALAALALAATASTALAQGMLDGEPPGGGDWQTEGYPNSSAGEERVGSSEPEYFVSDGNETAPLCLTEGLGASPLGAVGGWFARWLANGPAYGNVWYAFEAAQAYWAKAEYLTWDCKGDRIPALVTTSDPGTPQAQMGVLGLPTTAILFGEGRVNDSSRAGTRVSVGYGQLDGWHADYLALETEQSGFSTFSNGTPILARPFFDVEAGIADASLVAAPLVQFGFGQAVNLRGEITAKETSQVQSAGAGVRRLLWLDTWAPYLSYFRLQMTGGYRWFQLEETLSVADSVFPLGAPFVMGTRIDRQDVFRTLNEFHGGEIGLIAAVHHNRWGLELRSKLALGNMQQVVELTGRTSVFDTVSTITVERGLLVQPTNRGRYVDNEFALIPEVALDFSLQITPKWKGVVGYTFMYVSQAAQPGQFVDLNINPTLAGGGASNAPARPAFVAQDTDFYLHGLSGGFELKF